MIVPGERVIFGPCLTIVNTRFLATKAGCRGNEADISTSQSEAFTQARLSGPDEEQGGSKGAEPASTEGTQAAGGQRSEEVDPFPERRGYRLPRGARIRKRSDIRSLFRRGKRGRTRHLDVFVNDSPALRPRIGLVVPRHGRTIVERNRLKRHLREGARTTLLPRCLDEGVKLDVLLRARPEAYGAEFRQLWGEISELAERLCSRSF